MDIQNQNTFSDLYPEDRLTGAAAENYLESKLFSSIDELLEHPQYIMIETVNTCNSDCIMCGIDFPNKKIGRITDELFFKLIDEIKYFKNLKRLMLYLDCEPTMDKKLVNKIKYAKECGIDNINIASNASLLNHKKAPEYIESGLDEIYLTIDSLDKDTFEKIRKGLKFDIVYDNIVNFITLRNKLNPLLKIRIQMVQQEINYDEKDEFIRHWKELIGPNDQVVVVRAHNYGNNTNVMEFGDEKAINNIPCINPWSSIVIHIDGEVGLCSMDTNETVKLGNVKEKSIIEVWNNQNYKNIRELHLTGRRCDEPVCDGCTLWREEKHVRNKV
ncbi:radical SAM/SPASM domain-containing protein [Pseudomonadota bacterium]